MTIEVKTAVIPDVAHELLEKCRKKIEWIKKEGLERDDLQAAAEFAGDLVLDAQDLQEFLKGELKRQRGGHR